MSNEDSVSASDIEMPSFLDDKIDVGMKMDVIHSEILCQQPTSSSQEVEEKFVMTTQPVCVDQILTGNELNLELFIGENRNDPVVSSIEQSLESNVKKPKLAANIFEARKLAKVRKEIERNNQKKLEKATVLAKQYIRTNASAIRDDNQGIELEFVCMKSVDGEKTAGPIISSPVKYINGREITETTKRSTPTATVTSSALITLSSPILNANVDSKSSLLPSAEDTKSNDNGTNEIDFKGFEIMDIQLAMDNYHILSETIKKKWKKNSPKAKQSKATAKKMSNASIEQDTKHQQLMNMLANDNQRLFYENNKICNGLTTPRLMNRKRKATTSLNDDLTNSTTKLSSNDDNDMILASVFISQSANECSVKPDSSTRTGKTNIYENLECSIITLFFMSFN